MTCWVTPADSFGSRANCRNFGGHITIMVNLLLHRSERYLYATALNVGFLKRFGGL